LETEAHLSGFVFASNILFQTLTPAITIKIVFLIFFISISAIVAGAEVAFFLLSPANLAKSDSRQARKAKVLLSLLADPGKLLASLLTANIFLKFAAILILFILFNAVINVSIVSVWVALAIVLFISFVCFFLGETLAKIYARANPEKYSLAVTYPVFLFHLLFHPFSALNYRIIRVFDRNFLGQKSGANLSQAIELASDTHTEEEDILKGIVKFGNIDVSEILKPRVDVTALEFHISLMQVFSTVVESGYSRIPVYNENFDNIKGILYVKDLLPFINEKESFRWQSLIRPPYFVPETKKVKELLTEFQNNKIHMAIIVDEYGGTLGIVTLEDILEEIVGEITDESDEDEKNYSQINSNTYIFDGKILLNDFYKIVQTENDIFNVIKGEADTLAGLILELKGVIPALHEQIIYKQFTFKIEAVDNRRIKQIRVVINQEQNK
jgi:putative hemolysin